jgi:hypothetical protein
MERKLKLFPYPFVGFHREPPGDGLPSQFSADAPQRPRRVPAHQRFLVVERGGERRDGFGRAELPSATATLRSNPRRFVRFTAEPLKRRENSSCVIPIHPISDGPSIPSRGMKAGSCAGSANEFQGQTSWARCPLPRNRIELSGGRHTGRQPSARLCSDRMSGPTGTLIMAHSAYVRWRDRAHSYILHRSGASIFKGLIIARIVSQPSSSLD